MELDRTAGIAYFCHFPLLIYIFYMYVSLHINLLHQPVDKQSSAPPLSRNRSLFPVFSIILNISENSWKHTDMRSILAKDRLTDFLYIILCIDIMTQQCTGEKWSLARIGRVPVWYIYYFFKATVSIWVWIV